MRLVISTAKVVGSARARIFLPNSRCMEAGGASAAEMVVKERNARIMKAATFFIAG
jgi:hypothetical protein